MPPDTTLPNHQDDTSVEEEIAFQQALIIQNSIGGLIGGLGNVFPVALIKAVLVEVINLEEFWEQLLDQEAENAASDTQSEAE